MERSEEMRYTGDGEAYLLQIPMFTKEKHSPEQMEYIWKRIGRIPKGRIIHVAGTNGKGSVCAFLTGMLTAAGYQVGTFTSPHLQTVRERIAFCGEPISQRDFEHCFRLVLGDVRACIREGISHPAFFEFLFYMAMVYFYEKKADYIILETGMGGRLDVTNICRPAVTVITSVSMDHMEYLGNTLEAIAGEKAGIIKEGIPVVFAADSAVPREVIEKKAAVVKAPCFPVYSSEYQAEIMKNGGLAMKATWRTGKERTEISFRIPFPALYQGENGALALRTVQVLNQMESEEKITKDQAICGMEGAKWPARMEEILPKVYLDGAHNVDGILKFTQTVNKISTKVKLLFSVVSDKEYDKMAEILCENVSWTEISIAPINNRRGLDIKTIEAVFQSYAHCPVKGYDSAKEAFQEAVRNKKEEETLFCAGSLYFAGEIREVQKEYGYHQF